jgi:hypothetical protein
MATKEHPRRSNRRNATEDTQKSWIPDRDSTEPPLRYEEFLTELEDTQKCYEQLTILWNALRQMVDAVDEEGTERQKLRQQVLELKEELLEAKESAVRSGPRNTTDSDTSQRSERMKRSAKMPDPPALSDGVSPTFDSWLIKMEHKLRSNADHFEDEQDRIAYVFSRTEGNASEHLEPRMSRNSNERFATAEEALDYLTAIYVDPNREMSDRDDYRRLFMNKDTNFSDFHTKFRQLAMRASIPPASWQDDFYSKLPYDLQRALAPMRVTIRSFDELVNHCRATDQSLKRIDERQNRGRTPRNRSNPTTTAPAASNTRALAGGRATPSRTLDAEKRDQYMKEGRCFKCHELGHISRECPKKKESVALTQELGPEATESPKE